METDDSVDAPADSIKWAKNLLRAPVEQPSLVRRIVAVLTADLAGGRPAFGERSGSAQARQMLFTAGEYAIDLRVAGNMKKFEIEGQILGKEVGGGFVRLEGTKFEAALGKNGEFKLAGVSGGNYDLIVTVGEIELVAQNIELG